MIDQCGTSFVTIAVKKLKFLLSQTANDRFTVKSAIENEEDEGDINREKKLVEN